MPMFVTSNSKWLGVIGLVPLLTARQYLPTENLRLGEISCPHGARRLTSRERMAN